MQARGTTGLGRMCSRFRCHFSSCASPCATTARHRRTFGAGDQMHHRTGASTGARNGNNIAKAGTIGTTTQRPHLPHCQHISDSIPVIVIRARSSSPCFALSDIDINLVTPSGASSMSKNQHKDSLAPHRSGHRPHLKGIIRHPPGVSVRTSPTPFNSAVPRLRLQPTFTDKA